MSEIKTTRGEIQEKQETCLREKLIIDGMEYSEANSLASRIVSEFKNIEDNRSLSDLLRDMIEDAGGGMDGIDEVLTLISLERAALELEAEVDE